MSDLVKTEQYSDMTLSKSNITTSLFDLFSRFHNIEECNLWMQLIIQVSNHVRDHVWNQVQLQIHNQLYDQVLRHSHQHLIKNENDFI